MEALDALRACRRLSTHFVLRQERFWSTLGRTQQVERTQRQSEAVSSLWERLRREAAAVCPGEFGPSLSSRPAPSSAGGALRAQVLVMSRESKNGRHLMVQPSLFTQGKQTPHWCGVLTPGG